MPGLAPFAPAIATTLLGGAAMVDGNLQNKAAIKNQQNAQAAAQQQVQQNQGNAFANLSQFSNQGAAQPQAGGQPRFQGQNIPLAGGPPQAQQQQPAAGSQLSPQMQQQLMALLQQSHAG